MSCLRKGVLLRQNGFLAACLASTAQNTLLLFWNNDIFTVLKKTAFNLRKKTLLRSFGLTNTNHKQHPALEFTRALEFTQTATHKVLQTVSKY